MLHSALVFLSEWITPLSAHELLLGSTHRLISVVLCLLIHRSDRSAMSLQEESYRFLLFEADPTATPWSKLCVQQVSRELDVS